MAGLALVPAWFWVALGTILALAGLVVGVWKSRARAYWPEHRLRARDVVAVTEAEGRDFYGSMTLDGERQFSPAGYLRGLDRVLASTTTTNLARDPDDSYDPAEDEPFRWLPAPEVAHGEPTAAEVAASRAAHGYIPELAPETGGPELFACIYCEQDTPNGEPCPVCGWDRCAVCLRCADQAAHDIDDPGPGGPPWALVPPGPDQAHPAACPRCGLPHKEPHCADGYEWGPWPDPGAERLAWLDQQLAAHLEWARRVRGQVTGWGLEAAA